MKNWFLKSVLFYACSVLALCNACAATRVALVSTCGGETGQKMLALAEVELSANPDIVLVERAEVQRVLEEQKLMHCGLSEAAQAVAAGRFLGVQVFACLETLPGDKEALGLVVFDAVTGVKLADSTIAADGVEAAAKNIVGTVLEACVKRQRDVTTTRTVCLLSVRNLDLPHELNSLCDAIGLLLGRRLLDSADVTVLERQRLEEVNKERSLGAQHGTDVLLPSLTLIELEISRGENERGLAGTVYLTDSGGKETGKFRVKLQRRDANELTEALLRDLLRKLNVGPTAAKTDRMREAERFSNEATFLESDGDWPGALRAAEAAAALAPTNMVLQGRLARFLAGAAQRMVRNAEADVRPSLAVAQRALEIRQTIGAADLAGNAACTHECWAADPLLSGMGFTTARGYWEEILDGFAKQDRDGKDRMLEFQAHLRQVMIHDCNRVRLSRVHDFEGAFEYSDIMCELLGKLEKLVPSSNIWSADTLALCSDWLGVLDKYPMASAGWYESYTRALARLCCQASGCARPLPHINGWRLQRADLAAFPTLFGKMEHHSNRVVQCYGVIGQFAFELGEQPKLSPETLRHYEQTKDFIRQQIAIPPTAEENAFVPKPPYLGLNANAGGFYRSYCYSAALDLIDLLPDSALRRKEHLDLFEWALQRKELVYWTICMHADLGACRFMQYSMYPEVFPHEPVGYKPEDSPQLLANGRRALALWNAEGVLDVDASCYSFRHRSFDREIAAMQKTIYEKRPDLAPAPSAPWTAAKCLFDAAGSRSPRSIEALIVGGDSIYAAVTTSAVGTNRVQCWRIPLAGRAPTLLREVPVPDARSVGWSDYCNGTFYVATRDTGIYGFAQDGGTTIAINPDTGLLSAHTGPFTVTEGKLYVMLAEGNLVAYDLKSKGCEILASKRRKEKKSPLDNEPRGFRVTSMLADPKRHRVLFTIDLGPGSICDPLLGVWQIDSRTGQVSQLMRLYRPATWMKLTSEDEALVYCPRNIDGTTSCPDNWKSLVALDLTNDSGRMVCGYWNSFAGPNVPSTAGDCRVTLHAQPPFLFVDGWLWYLDEISSRRNVTTSQVEELASPGGTERNRLAHWRFLHFLKQTRQIVAADSQSVWLLTLPPGPAKDSS